MVLHESGKKPKVTNVTDHSDFSVAEDGVIYLSAYGMGLYASTDDGVTWNYLLQKPPQGANYLIRVLRLIVDNAPDTYWTVENVVLPVVGAGLYQRVGVYEGLVNQGNLTLTKLNISLPPLLSNASYPIWLTHDGYGNMICTDMANNGYRWTVSIEFNC